MLRVETTLLFDFLIITSLLVALGSCTNLAFPDDAHAEPVREKRLKQGPPGPPPANPKLPGKASTPMKKDHTTGAKPSSPSSAPGTKPPTLRTQDPTHGTRRSTALPKRPLPEKAAPVGSSAATGKYHRKFVASLTNAPFPHTGKDVDPHFFDFTDPKTGERFRTTRTLERLSEKDHYRDSSVLFYVPRTFNPGKPFFYVVFFHGNRSDVQQCMKDFRLDEQIESSRRNVILLIPQLAKNASDSSPGNFSRNNAFKAFMQEAAQVLSPKFGKKYRRPLEQAPVILAAFSGGYKPLTCALDRGGTGFRVKGVLLLDALYEDLYIFGKWILSHDGRGVFVNIFTEGSACDEKTRTLAQFLSEHRVPFKKEWPKGGFPKKPIFLIGSPLEHMQIPVDGPPREPLAAMLRSLKI